MAITVKLFTQIVNECIGWMQVHAPEITDFNDGAITKSLIEDMAQQLDFQNLQIENAQAAAAILTASGVDLDLKVADYGIVRKAAVAATGQLRFTLTSPAPVGGFTIQKDTVVSTPPTFNPYDATSYSTVADLTFAEGDTLGTIGGIATIAGAASNEPINAIIVLTTAISGVSSVTNTAAFTGGADAESDIALRSRGVAAFVSSTNDKAAAYVSAVQAVAGILTAATAGFGDPIMTRDNGQGGKVDIYYQGVTDIQTTTETFSYSSIILAGDYAFSPYVYAPPAFNVLRNIPVVAITSVTNLTTAAVIDPSHYALVSDTSDAFGGSDRAADVLHWLDTTGLSDGDEIEVEFTYDNMVEKARLAAEAKRGTTVDLLVKPGTPVPVNVAITVNAKTAAAIAALQTTLVATLMTILSTRLLNQDLLQALIAQKIMQTANVQNLKLPLDLLSISVSGVSDIIVNESEYITPGTIQVNVQPPLTIQ